MTRCWSLTCIVVLSLAAIVFSTGCESSSHARLRFMNASPDESSLNRRIDGNAVVSNVAYGTASNYTHVSSGSRHIQVMKLRVVNAVPALAPVDVYVVAPGTGLNTVSPTISSLALFSASSYQSLTAGSYEVIFTAPGQKFAYIDSASLTFSAGQIRTIVALNGQVRGYTMTVLNDVN